MCSVNLISVDFHFHPGLWTHWIIWFFEKNFENYSTPIKNNNDSCLLGPSYHRKCCVDRRTCSLVCSFQLDWANWGWLLDSCVLLPLSSFYRQSVSTWCCVRVCVVFILCTFYLFVQLWVWHFMRFDYLLFVLLVYSALSLLYGRNMRYINIIISTIIILLQNIGRLQPSEEGDATFCVAFFSLHKRIKNQLGWFVLVYSVFVFLISSSAKCNT